MIDLGYGNLQGQLQNQMAQMQGQVQQMPPLPQAQVQNPTLDATQQQQQPQGTEELTHPHLQQAQGQQTQQVQQQQQQGVLQRGLREDEEVSVQQVVESMLDDETTQQQHKKRRLDEDETVKLLVTVTGTGPQPSVSPAPQAQTDVTLQQQQQVQHVQQQQVQQHQQIHNPTAQPMPALAPPPTYLIPTAPHMTTQMHPAQPQTQEQQPPPQPQPQPQPQPDINNTIVQTQTDQQQFFTMLSSDQNQIAEARRKMNNLLQTQLSAQEELKAAEENLEHARERITLARQNIKVTETAVNQGTEQLTDALLQEPTHWNAMYRKMIEYKEKNGNVDVKRNPLKTEREANPEIVKLGSWVGRVRLEARRPPGHPEHIEPYKVIALNRLGFNWEPRENYWMEKYDELKSYMTAHGKHKMPTRKEPLGVWCDGQVLEYNKFHSGIKPCYITKERIDMLNDIGFVWDRMGTAWKDSFEDLKKYRDTNGHCHVPVNYGDKTLFRWIAKQRKKFKNRESGKKPALTDEQVKMLDEIDFFEPSEERLAKYQAQQEKNTNKKDKKTAKSKGRGRPKSKTLIPREAQVAMNNNAAMSGSSVPPFILPPINMPTLPVSVTLPIPGLPENPLTALQPPLANSTIAPIPAPVPPVVAEEQDKKNEVIEVLPPKELPQVMQETPQVQQEPTSVQESNATVVAKDSHLSATATASGNLNKGTSEDFIEKQGISGAEEKTAANFDDDTRAAVQMI